MSSAGGDVARVTSTPRETMTGTRVQKEIFSDGIWNAGHQLELFLTGLGTCLTFPLSWPAEAGATPS